MVISGSCQESTPSTQERGKKMRRKRFQKGSLQARKHGRHRVWVAFWWEDGSRRSKVWGRCSQMSKAEAEAATSAMLRDINSGVAQMAKPVYTFEQFVKRRVFAVLPPQLEGIDRGHLGADRQIASCPGVREASASCDPARGIARLPRPEGAGSYPPASVCPSAVVPEWGFQAGHVGRADSEQSGGRVENSKKMPAGPRDAPADGRGGESVPGGLRPPGEVDCEARNFRRHAARRDPGASVEVGCRRSHPGGGARLQTGVRTRRRTARPARARSRTARSSC